MSEKKWGEVDVAVGKRSNALWAMAVGMFVMAPAELLVRAFVVAKVWAWFIVPLGAQAISKVQAAGVSILFSVLMVGHIPDMSNLTTRVKPEDVNLVAICVERATTRMGIMLMFLLVCWILRQL